MIFRKKDKVISRDEALLALAKENEQVLKEMTNNIAKMQSLLDETTEMLIKHTTKSIDIIDRMN